MIAAFNHPETWLVAAPALGAAFMFMGGESHRRFWVTLVSSANMLALVFTIMRLFAGGPYAHALGGWDAPLGIRWHIDGLAATMLLLSTVTGVMISIYALAYFGKSADERHRATYFWPLWFLLWSALNALFLSRDLFNWYVTLELSGLAAVALITLSGKTEALRGGMRYLLLALGASLFYLLGVALLYAAYGVLDLDQLATLAQPDVVTATALALITLGLIVKAALFPLHFWLPPAHANAPSPVSAALSALVVKGGFYITLRLIMELWPRELAAGLMNGLGALGAAAILLGSYHAIRQNKLKRLIAYSTVAQLGYLFIIFPLIRHGWEFHAPWAATAWAGGVYQVIAHGIAKASLFLAAGVLIHARGSDDLEGLRGLGEKLPITVTAMALAGMSLMGIPPGAGFIAKWMMLSVAVSAQHWVWAIVMVLGGLMAVGYLFRVYRRLMTTAEHPVFHAPPRRLEMAALILAIFSVIFGLSAVPVLTLLDIGAPLPLLTEITAGGAP